MGKRDDTGLIVRVTGGDVWVARGGDVVPAQLRGRLRQKRRFQPVAGDRVRLSAGEGGNVAIESVEPRDSFLSRYIDRNEAERLIVANVDALFVVASLVSPEVHYAFVDRVLAAAERGHIDSAVVLNKIDLAGTAEADTVARVYSGCGYDVLRTSAETGEGIDALAARIGSGIYAFVGESGVGKSSLLMALDPNLDLKVRTVGDRTQRGRHTTTFSQLYPFRDGHLADTPGVQTFGFAGDVADVAASFPEFTAYEGDCRFSPCTHSHEPKCGVKDAVERDEIARSRYDSYISILEEVTAREKRTSW